MKFKVSEHYIVKVKRGNNTPKLYFYHVLHIRTTGAKGMRTPQENEGRHNNEDKNTVEILTNRDKTIYEVENVKRVCKVENVTHK